MFKICEGYDFATIGKVSKGFHMTFPNGWTVSVQFGEGNYCDNKYKINRENGVVVCPNAEVACWDAAGKKATIVPGDQVAGYVDTLEVLALMNVVASMPKGTAAVDGGPVLREAYKALPAKKDEGCDCSCHDLTVSAGCGNCECAA
jgi:hypothetical protein